LILLSLTIPLIMDNVLDLFNITLIHGDHSGIKAQGSKVDDCSFNGMERVLFIFSMIAVPASLFIPEGYPKATLMLVCLRKCRFIFFAGAICSSFSRKGQLFPKPVSLLCEAMYTTAQVLGIFAANTSEVVRSGGAFYSTCYYITMIFGYLPAVILTAYCAIWMIRVSGAEVRVRRILFRDDNDYASEMLALLQDVHPGYYLYYRVIFILSVILCAGFTTASNLTYKNNYYMDDKGLFLDSFPYILFVLWESALSMRFIKFEILRGLVSVY
jgi:hypothetical protein